MPLATYLRNVATDQRDMGRDCTAKDYEQAATAIEELTAALHGMIDEYAKDKHNDLPIDKAARAALAKVSQ